MGAIDRKPEKPATGEGEWVETARAIRADVEAAPYGRKLQIQKEIAARLGVSPQAVRASLAALRFRDALEAAAPHAAARLMRLPFTAVDVLGRWWRRDAPAAEAALADMAAGRLTIRGLIERERATREATRPRAASLPPEVKALWAARAADAIRPDRIVRAAAPPPGGEDWSAPSAEERRLGVDAVAYRGAGLDPAGLVRVPRYATVERYDWEATNFALKWLGLACLYNPLYVVHPSPEILERIHGLVSPLVAPLLDAHVIRVVDDPAFREES